MIQSFKDMVPVVHPTAFVHPQAVVIGHVTIGALIASSGAGAVLAGRLGPHRAWRRDAMSRKTAVVHMFPGTTVKH